MRKLFVVLLAVAPAAFAQQKNELSIFYNNLSGGSSGSGTHFNGGPGLRLTHAFSPLFSIEASIAHESYSVFRPTTPTTFEQVSVRSNPIDVAARYHFVNESHWKPFIGGGLRYVNLSQINGSGGRFNVVRIESEIVGGIEWQVRRFSLVFEAQQLLGNNSLSTDPAFKPSVGIGYRW
jgi:outer membrane protein W